MSFDIAPFASILVKDMADAVIYADAEGRILFWNKAASRIFGFSQEEALSKTLDIVIPKNLRDRHWKGYEETMRTGKTRYGTSDVLAVPALRSDGGRISVEFTILPFRDAAGRLVGIAAVLRDVTKRFNETKALRKRIALMEAGTFA